MSTELDTLNARIAERIGKDLVELIPAEQWQQLVDTEVNKFKRVVAPKIIQELLKEAYLDKAERSVNELCQTEEWDELSETYTNPALTKLLAASGGAIFAGVMGPAMQMVMQDLRSRLGY